MTKVEEMALLGILEDQLGANHRAMNGLHLNEDERRQALAGLIALEQRIQAQTEQRRRHAASFAHRDPAPRWARMGRAFGLVARLRIRASLVWSRQSWVVAATLSEITPTRDRQSGDLALEARRLEVSRSI